jgi:hypothetical protein
VEKNAARANAYEWDFLTAFAWILWRDEQKALSEERDPLLCALPESIFEAEICRKWIPGRAATEETTAKLMSLKRRMDDGQIVCFGTPVFRNGRRGTLTAIPLEHLQDADFTQLNSDVVLRRKRIWRGRATERPPLFFERLHFSRDELRREWPGAKVADAQPGAVSVPTLLRFLKDFADGTKSETECLQAAKENFAAAIPEKSTWRPAWQKLPPNQKLPRGQKRNGATNTAN